MSDDFPTGAPPEGRWRRSADVLWRTAGRDLMLLPRGLDSPIEVSGPGLALWHVLEKERPLSEVVAVLAEAFDVADTVVLPDVAALLERLREVGAVEHRT